jgi:hypothetical protein
MYKIKEKMD